MNDKLKKGRKKNNKKNNYEGIYSILCGGGK